MDGDNGSRGENENSGIEAGTQTIQIQRLLDRLQAGDESARKELIDCACTDWSGSRAGCSAIGSAFTAGNRPATCCKTP